MERKLPAEWEEQDGVLLSWPHENTDWASSLKNVQSVFVRIAAQISKQEKCLIIAPNRVATSRLLRDAGAVAENLRLFQVDSNDTWARDFGPITVSHNGAPLLLDFAFNGWGLKFPANRDNLISRQLKKQGAFGATPMETLGLVLEGGSIESDGAGTLLTTSRCLLSPNRNPHLSRDQLERALYRHLGTDRFLWLEHGYLAGDDTDSHIDTLARFASEDTIVHVDCDDPDDEHYGAIQSMGGQLKSFRTRKGLPYELVPLPWPRAVHDESGRRLPATYANFLIVNGAVLVPTYDDPRDEKALEILQHVFKDREVMGIPCLPLIHEGGSLHCLTMQLPKGVLP